MTKKKCSVKGCKNEVNEAWIDIIGNDKKEGRWISRSPFCDEHFDIVYPYAKKKERQECKKNTFWIGVPIEIVNEALNQ